jgi:hypothetical protein
LALIETLGCFDITPPICTIFCTNSGNQSFLSSLSMALSGFEPLTERV